MKIVDLGTGKCSWFGGPADSGVGPQEGLGLIEQNDIGEWWFKRLFQTSQGGWDPQKGLARNLNPNALYLAMRFAYSSFDGVKGEILEGFTREQIRRAVFIVTFNGRSAFGQAADWGPAGDTDRLIDLSPGLCKALGAQTDDAVTVQVVI